MITPAQCRAARALIDVTQRELADMAELGESTIRDFEAGRRVPLEESIAAMVAALERAGIELLNHGSPGVRLKPQGSSRARKK